MKLNLTKTDRQILQALLVNNVATHEALHNAIQHSATADKKHLIKTYINKLRNKLKIYNIEIHTLFGTGYRMTRENRDKLNCVLIGYGDICQSTLRGSED